VCLGLTIVLIFIYFDYLWFVLKYNTIDMLVHFLNVIYKSILMASDVKAKNILYQHLLKRKKMI